MMPAAKPSFPQSGLSREAELDKRGGARTGKLMKKHLAVLAAAAMAAACGHSGQADVATLTSTSDQVIWEAGLKDLEKSRWESARQYFKRLIEGFPRSEWGPAARLALGDSYYKEGGTANYILAIAEYREFLTLHPSHPRSDYAQLQVAECHFRQRNGPDRDQTTTEQALEEYERFLHLYPASPHVEVARVRLAECRQSLARSEFLAGFFYQRTRQAYRAAILRYEGLLANYPDYRATDEILFRLAECLALSGREPEALPHLSRLLESYPGSPRADAARRLMSQVTQKASAPPPVAPTPPGAVPAAPPQPSLREDKPPGRPRSVP